jgi:hypothetical protein
MFQLIKKGVKIKKKGDAGNPAFLRRLSPHP